MWRPATNAETNPASERHADGGVVRHAYNAFGDRYDAAGQLVHIDGAAIGQQTDYAYNASGARVLERTTQGGVICQDSHLAYDALGRLRDVADTRVHLTIDYDNAGNRVHEHTHVLTMQDPAKDSDLWYAYDAMTRQMVVDGTTPQGGIVQGQPRE
ncbi:hypothetical protein [Burkholderia sp. 9120]|nr:hypothetical protein [Burkholderia sp. 9120]